MVASPRWFAAAVFLCVVVASGSRAAAQAVYQDVQQELYDMQRLNYDRNRLNYDLNNGNLFSALVDELRIGVDQQRVQGDEMRLQYDLSRQPYGFAPMQAQSLVPHPQYPGYYYYPSNPAQLYYYPNQPPQPMGAGVGATPSSPGPAQVQPNALPGAGSSTNPAATPMMTVTIRNQDSSGLAINYTVNGTPYATTNGSVQTLDVPARAQVVFDRGGAFGATRYTLTPGSYDFQITERGWELYKQRPTPTASPFAPAGAPAAAANPAQNALPSRPNSDPPPPPTPAPVDDTSR